MSYTITLTDEQYAALSQMVDLEEAGFTVTQNQQTWPIGRYLDLSTAHLSMQEREDLQAAPPRVIEHEYGWWVNVPHDDVDELDAMFAEDGEFPNLHAVINYARERDCNWVNFDTDGAVISDIPLPQSSE